MAELKLRFGEILVRAGLLDEKRLQSALAEQKKWGGRLGRVLVELGYCDEHTVVAALSRHLNLAATDIEAAPPPLDVVQLVSVQDCERYGVFPLGTDRDRRHLRLATADPTNHDALYELQGRVGMKIEPVVAGTTDIDRAIRRYYYGETGKQSPKPSDFGVNEAVFNLDAPPRVAPTAPAPAPAPAPVLVAENAALVERVARLEDLVGRQARALRTLVEMLVDKGQLDRADYVKRVRGDEAP